MIVLDKGIGKRFRIIHRSNLFYDISIVIQFVCDLVIYQDEEDINVYINLMSSPVLDGFKLEKVKSVFKIDGDKR